MLIRLIEPRDHAAVWEVIGPTIRAGETYALSATMPEEEAIRYWTSYDKETFIVEDENRILGTFYLRANQPGGGSHVANCGYITPSAAQGKGVARLMCSYSLDLARSKGFRAMQFNFVVATNERAIQLWQSMGFAIVGTLPEAFKHPILGFVNAHVMSRKL